MKIKIKLLGERDQILGVGFAIENEGAVSICAQDSGTVEKVTYTLLGTESLPVEMEKTKVHKGDYINVIPYSTGFIELHV